MHYLEWIDKKQQERETMGELFDEVVQDRIRLKAENGELREMLKRLISVIMHPKTTKTAIQLMVGSVRALLAKPEGK